MGSHEVAVKLLAGAAVIWRQVLVPHWLLARDFNSSQCEPLIAGPSVLMMWQLTSPRASDPRGRERERVQGRSHSSLVYHCQSWEWCTIMSAIFHWSYRPTLVQWEKGYARVWIPGGRGLGAISEAGYPPCLGKSLAEGHALKRWIVWIS